MVQPESPSRPVTTHAEDVTETVRLWIINDGDYYDRAWTLAHHWLEWGGQDFELYITGTLRDARRESVPWYVARNLSANDYDLIDWHSLATDLTAV